VRILLQNTEIWIFKRNSRIEAAERYSKGCTNCKI